MLSRARQAYWDLLAKAQTWSAPRVHIPSADDLIGALSCEGGVLASMKAHVRVGTSATARSAVCRHFAQRLAPRFFIDLAEVSSIAQQMARTHPHWPRQALCTAEVSVAGLSGAAGGTFPGNWSALPRAPGNDTLAWHRPHQLSWLTHLARARVFGHETHPMLVDGLESWMNGVDGRRSSPAYGDALIAVHRGVSLTWALQFLLAIDGADETLSFNILRVLLGDARFVYSHLGESYPNNHLLADGFFCWYMGLLFPEFADAAQWHSDGEALWLEELRRQVLPDGASFEHSVHYHELVCEMLSAYVLLSRRNGIDVPGWIHERARNMLAFQAAVGGVEATTVPVGDAIEDSLFALDDFEGIGSGGHRELLRRLYAPEAAALCAPDRGLQRAIWLTGDVSPVNTVKPADGASTAFCDGGFFVLRQRSSGNRLVFRTGPAQGMPLTAGHMHADLLSISVIVEGTPVLVDPGTYSYRARSTAWPPGEPPWRRHFMSAQAHNGPCLGGLDPLDRGEGDFPAGEPKASIRNDLVLLTDQVSCVTATIEGSTPYAGHRRTVLQVADEYWVVIDRFPPDPCELPFLNFQFAQRAGVRKLTGGGNQVDISGVTLAMMTDNLAEPVEHYGSRSPVAGWVSPAYGVLQPAPCLRFSPRMPSQLTGVVLLPSHDRCVNLRCVSGPDADFKVIVDSGDQCDVIHVGISSRDAMTRNEPDVDAQGTLAWFRFRGGMLTRVAVVGDQSCALRVRDGDFRRMLRRPGSVAGALIAWNADRPDAYET